MARRVHGVSRPFHGRHRLVHAGALALRPRARGVLAPLARRPAARRRRTHRMEKRRTALWLAGAGALALAPAFACTPPVEGTRLESARYVLAYKPGSISVGNHFSLDIGVCPKSGTDPETLKVDAQMPEHKHGMNY